MACIDGSQPGDEEKAFYHRNGWLLTNLFVSEECLEACRQAVEEAYRGEYDRVYPWSYAEENENFGQPYSDRTKPRLDAYLSLHKTAVRLVLHAPQLAAYAAALIGTAKVRLYRDLLLSMPGGQGASTGWHVDKNYWPTCSSDKLTTAWFPLDDCDVENGCLSVISGSHRWKRTTFLKKIPLAEVDKIGRLFGKQSTEIEVVSVPHRRGQISFHSCLLIHGTYPNVSDLDRRSFAVVFQDEANRYADGTTSKARRRLNFNTNDRLGPKNADGTPDYTDPEFYPVLYSESSTEPLIRRP